jgi:Na+ dependent nucleoside transporter C-terminus/Protein of unknown function (DUF3562)
MAVPGGLLLAKIIHPTTEASRVTLGNLDFDEKRPANVIEAASSGATVGLKIAVMVDRRTRLRKQSRRCKDTFREVANGALIQDYVSLFAEKRVRANLRAALPVSNE